MLNYTRKEREAINAAWTTVLHFADTLDHTATNMLETALRLERKARDSSTAAKALLLQSLADPRTATAGLYVIAPGCGQAMIFGAFCAEQYAKRFAPIRRQARAAGQAHDAAVSQTLDAIANS